MTDRFLDLSIRRSANETWYVSRRASQHGRFSCCLDMLHSHLPELGLVYDIGSGTGHFARLLAGRAHEVVGVERMLERAELCRSDPANPPNLKFVHGDFLELDVPEGEADAVCALEMLYYVPAEHWSRLLEKISRTLKAGGVLLVSLNVFSGDGPDQEQALIEAVGKHFETLETRHMHRMYYYRLELPLIRFLDEINYLESVKVFYPHTLSVGHVVYSPLLDRLLLRPSWLLDRLILPACKHLALMTLASRALYRVVTATSRFLAPRTSRTQTILLARRPASEPVRNTNGDCDAAPDRG